MEQWQSFQPFEPSKRGQAAICPASEPVRFVLCASFPWLNHVVHAVDVAMRRFVGQLPAQVLDILLLRAVLVRHKRITDLVNVVAAFLLAHWFDQWIPVRPVVVATLVRAALVHGV